MHHAIRIGKPHLTRFAWNWLAGALLIFVATFAFAAGNADVSATVDRNVLGPDDTFTLSVTVSSSDDVAASQPTLPPLSDFEILNEWSSQEARASIVSGPNGPQFKTTRTTRHNFMLQPKREGKLHIGTVEVVVDGRSYHTKPITVTVDPNAAPQQQAGGGQGANPGNGFPPAFVQPPPGFLDDEEDDLFSQLLRRGQPQGTGSRTLPINPNDAFFIQVETDKAEAYVGEQITVSWYLYTRGQIRDLDTLKYPSLRGFWKEDIEIATHLNFTQEVVNGLPYKKALLASFALFPIKEGTSVIDSYTAKCSVIPSLDSFGGGFSFGKAYTYTKSSQPVKVHVKPLPTEGRPANFSGAVGDFQVSARVEDNNPVANQPFTLKLRFEGRGNAKLIDLPPFEPPQGLEIYDTQNEAKFFRTGTSYKDFTVLLIPRSEGDYTIPPISVSMFDPQQQKYVTKSTEPIQVHVGKGQGGGPNTPSLTVGQESKGKKAQDVAPQLQTEWSDGRKTNPAGQALGFSGLFGVVALTLLWRARNELGWGQKKKDLMRQLKARLRRVNTNVEKGDWRNVGVEMTNTVYFILGAVSGEGGANVELEKLLLKAPPSVRRELGEPVTKLMEKFQVLTFAPEDVVGKLKEPAELRKSVSEMEKLLEKAVALGLSSGQSGESGSGPRAS